MRISKETIKDAVRPLQLSITKRDITSSKRKAPDSCAAATCLLRMDGVEAARVHKTRTFVRKNGVWTRYLTPLSLKLELVAFDRGGRFEPGTHMLLPVPHYDRPTGKRQGSGKDKRTGRGKARTYHVVSGVRYSAKEGL